MRVVRINTTHGETYCEVYEPANAGDKKDNQSSSPPVLMIHGCGGSVDHWRGSGIPMLLAKTGRTVVTYDFYSHGKSVQLSSKTVRHNLSLFMSQLDEVIHSPELPIAAAESFTAHGFSMGCYILLQYCVRYSPFKNNVSPGSSSSAKPWVNKIILQSPWDGHVPAFLRGLIRIPLLLRIFKPWDMAGIKSINALKQILLKLDEKVDYRESMTSFGKSVSGEINYSCTSNSTDNADVAQINIAITTSEEDTEVASPVATTTINTDDTEGDFPQPVLVETANLNLALKQGGIECPVLVITGTRELPFEITGRRIARYVHKHHTAQKQATTPSSVLTTSEPAGAKASAPPKVASTPTCGKKKVPAYLQDESIVQFKICKYAGHMSFVKKKDGTYVRTFFQKEIVKFVTGEELSL